MNMARQWAWDRIQAEVDYRTEEMRKLAGVRRWRSARERGVTGRRHGTGAKPAGECR